MISLPRILRHTLLKHPLTQQICATVFEGKIWYSRIFKKSQSATYEKYVWKSILHTFKIYLKIVHFWGQDPRQQAFPILFVSFFSQWVIFFLRSYCTLIRVIWFWWRCSCMVRLSVVSWRNQWVEHGSVHLGSCGCQDSRLCAVWLIIPGGRYCANKREKCQKLIHLILLNLHLHGWLATS